MYFLVALIPIALIIAIIILAFFVLTSKEKKGDHNDGGGKRYGGLQHIDFFQSKQTRAGEEGEAYVNRHLRVLLRNDEYLLANLLIPLKNGNKCEIDHVIISRKGIFCVETKNWVGHIVGTEDGDVWYQQYDDPLRPTKEVKNPIKQNRAHCEILEKTLNFKYVVRTAIIFLRTEDITGTYTSFVYSLSEFKEHFRNLPENKLTVEEINAAFAVLSKFVATQEQLREYKKSMSQKNN